MCRKSGIFLFVLLVVSFSLWAFPGRATGSPEKTLIGMSVPEAPEGGQRTDSGKVLESILIKPSESLTAQEMEALKSELLAAKKDYEALRVTSIEKDAVIDALSEENSRMKDESGSKAYLMVDAIVGFENALPEYGVGLTIGSRVGNSLMLEAGADYMLGSSLADLRSFSMDDLVFRAGIGWMF